MGIEAHYLSTSRVPRSNRGNHTKTWQMVWYWRQKVCVGTGGSICCLWFFASPIAKCRHTMLYRTPLVNVSQHIKPYVKDNLEVKRLAKRW